MDATKSLVESRAFWGAVLALIAIVAKAFNVPQLAAWAIDPNTLDAMLTTVGALGTGLAIFGRMIATRQITSVLPQKPPAATTNSPWTVGVVSVCLVALMLAGCTVSGAVADIKAVAAKIDAGYQIAAEELPAGCSIARTAGSLMASAIQLGATKNLGPKTQATIAQAQIGVAAAGTSDMCVAASKGLTPANPAEASAQIVNAFVQVRAAVQGTPINASATAAASATGG